MAAVVAAGNHGDRWSSLHHQLSGNGGVGVQVNIIPSPPSINSGNGYHWAGGGGGGGYNSTDPNRHAGDGGLVVAVEVV